MIGKAVYNILANDSALAALVSTNIFPEVAPAGTEAPVVVFSVESIQPEYSRSGLDRDASTVAVLCFSKDYTDSIDILIAVRNALELKVGIFNTVQIGKAQVQQIISGYDFETETHYQKITFDFENVNTYYLLFLILIYELILF